MLGREGEGEEQEGAEGGKKWKKGGVGREEGKGNMEEGEGEGVCGGGGCREEGWGEERSSWRIGRGQGKDQGRAGACEQHGAAKKKERAGGDMWGGCFPDIVQGWL